MGDTVDNPMAGDSWPLHRCWCMEGTEGGLGGRSVGKRARSVVQTLVCSLLARQLQVDPLEQEAFSLTHFGMGITADGS